MKRLFAAFFAALAFAALPAQEPKTAERIRARLGSKVREAQIHCEPDGKTLCLLYYAQNSYQALCLDRAAVQKVKAAFSKYEKDFGARRLKRSSPASTVRAYGHAACLLRWGSKKDDLSRFSSAKIRMGYIFEGASPYFCLAVPSAQSQDESKSPALQSSESVRLLLTRSAVKSLLDLSAGMT